MKLHPICFFLILLFALPANAIPTADELANTERQVQTMFEKLQRAEENLWQAYERAEGAYEELKQTKGTDFFQAVDKAAKGTGELAAEILLVELGATIAEKETELALRRRASLEVAAKAGKQAGSLVKFLGAAKTAFDIGYWLALDATLIARNVRGNWITLTELWPAKQRYDEALAQYEAAQFHLSRLNQGGQTYLTAGSLLSVPIILNVQGRRIPLRIVSQHAIQVEEKRYWLCLVDMPPFTGFQGQRLVMVNQRGQLIQDRAIVAKGFFTEVVFQRIQKMAQLPGTKYDLIGKYLTFGKYLMPFKPAVAWVLFQPGQMFVSVVTHVVLLSAAKEVIVQAFEQFYSHPRDACRDIAYAH